MEIINFKDIKKKQEDVCILVGRKKIQWIAYNFKMTEHADIRIIQRDELIDRNFKNSIRDTVLAWKNINGTISIALDLYKYIIVDIKQENGKDVPYIVTFADTRDSREKDRDVVVKMFKEYKKFISKRRGV